MRYISFKDNCRFKNWTPALSEIIDALDFVMNNYDWIPQLVITSINDSDHIHNSRHYTDEALDVRSRNFPNIDKLRFVQIVEEKLGDKFTVLFEGEGTTNEHFHIQVAKGETYP